MRRAQSMPAPTHRRVLALLVAAFVPSCKVAPRESTPDASRADTITATAAAARAPAPKPAPRAVAGTVRFEGAPRPASFTVSLGDRTITSTSAAGRFHFAAVEAPLSSLHVEAPGFASMNAYAVLPTTGDADLEVTMHAACTVRGIVRDAHRREPVGGAQITVTHAELTPYFALRPSAQAGANGRFELGDLPPGRAYFSASATGLARAFAGPIDVRRDPPAKLELILQPSVTVSGRIRRGSTPIAGANVELRLDQADAAALGLTFTSAETNDDGSFTLADSSRGPRRLVVTAGSEGTPARGIQYAMRLDVPARGISKLDINLARGPVKVHVDFPSGEPGEALLVDGHLDPEKNLELDAVVGAYQYVEVGAEDHLVAFEDVAPGQHTFIVRPPPDERLRPGGCHCLMKMLDIAPDTQEKEIHVEMRGKR